MNKNIKLNFIDYKSKFSSLFPSQFKSQFSSSIPTESRLKNLEHIRERLDELEQLVTYYQTDLHKQHNEQTDNAPKHLDKLSSELTAKRL
jgi:hypothetical protein